MKVSQIGFLIVLTTTISVYSQQTEYELTPWGWTVVTIVETEMETETRRTADSTYESNYPNATFHDTYEYRPGFYYSSTNLFNCHGYVWFMSDIADGDDLDDPRWINKSGGTLPYISDGISYKVVSESEADIVWWSTGSHSALTTGSYRVWQSKWADGPLATHEWNETPYGTSNLVFYKRCFYRLSQAFTVDETRNHCKVQLINSSVYNNVDLEIEYEDWVKIEGTFSTGTGATLDIHPQSN